MKKLLALIGIVENPKYKVVEVKVGVKSRYQIRKVSFGFLVKTVMNKTLVKPAPYEYKIRTEAERMASKLQSIAAA